MQSIKTKACNGVLLGEHLSKPGAHVFDLPVQHDVENNRDVVRSFWKPTDEEIVTLARGGHVVFDMWGVTHPPIRVTIEGKENG